MMDDLREYLRNKYGPEGIGSSVETAFTPIPNGTKVSWHYRSAIGHGTIVGVSKMGTSPATTEYSIREDDHHVSASGSKEPAIVHHYGSALSRA